MGGFTLASTLIVVIFVSTCKPRFHNYLQYVTEPGEGMFVSPPAVLQFAYGVYILREVMVGF